MSQPNAGNLMGGEEVPDEIYDRVFQKSPTGLLTQFPVNTNFTKSYFYTQSSTQGGNARVVGDFVIPCGGVWIITTNFKLTTLTTGWVRVVKMGFSKIDSSSGILASGELAAGGRQFMSMLEEVTVPGLFMQDHLCLVYNNYSSNALPQKIYILGSFYNTTTSNGSTAVSPLPTISGITSWSRIA